MEQTLGFLGTEKNRDRNCLLIVVLSLCTVYVGMVHHGHHHDGHNCHGSLWSRWRYYFVNFVPCLDQEK